ncbi:MAG: PPC domain-containing DNA-binding protein [Methanomethylophilus sp.]|jgi:predicted DNA-binding protein with PD1-like motif
MQYREMQRGRVFVLRLEEGDLVKQSVEKFAKDHGIKYAYFQMEGSVKAGSRFVVGLHMVDGHEEPRIFETDANEEFHGVGTIIPEEYTGDPVIHMHGSLGHNGGSVTGCFRDCITVDFTMEVIIQELLGEGLLRISDAMCGVRSLVIEKAEDEPGVKNTGKCQ